MRASAVQLNSNEDKARNLEIAERLVARRGRDGAELVVLPEKFNVLGSPEQLVAGAEPLDGPTLAWAAALAAELGHLARRGQHRRARRGRRQAAQHLGRCSTPTAARAPSTARSTCSTSRSAASPTASRTSRRPATRSSSRTPAALELGLAVCYDLRFPELFRIMAVRGARGVHAARGVHGPHRPRALGGAGPRPRDREPGVRDRGRAGRPPPAGPRELRPLDDRRRVGHGARARRDEPSASSIADLDLDAQDDDPREAARRSRTAGPTPTAGPSRARRPSS